MSRSFRTRAVLREGFVEPVKRRRLADRLLGSTATLALLAVPVLVTGLGIVLPAEAQTNLGNSGTTIDLSNDGTGDNPFHVISGALITGGATTANGIDDTGASSPGVYTLTNYGTITGGNSAAGIYLRNSAVITNNGTLTGGNFGLLLKGGTGASTVTNFGTIQSGTAGTAIYLRAGTVTNSGLISGGTGTINAAITLHSPGGLVTNANLGTITGAYGAKLSTTAQSGASTLVNDGTITGTGTLGSANAVYFGSGGTLTNSAFGRITGGVYGLRLFGTNDVSNSGTIIGTRQTGVYSLSGGMITNSGAAALIEGGRNGVLTNIAAVTLVNQGTIAGTGTTSFGLYLVTGGTVTNAATGTITAVTQGIYFRDTGGTITNSGTISATGISSQGIYLKVGGTVINNAGATIMAVSDGVHMGSVGTLSNAGTIRNTSASGIAAYLFSGGTVTNSNSGSILGAGTGVDLKGAGTVTNDGTITGTTNFGVALVAGGTLTNSATGTITGGSRGVLISGGSVNNAGTIAGTSGAGIVFTDAAGTLNNTVIDSGAMSGSNGTALQFGAGNDLLQLVPSAVLTGVADGGAGTNTLELAAGTLGNTGTVNGASFTNFGTVTVDAGAAWTLAGTGTFGTVNDAGTFTTTGTLNGSVTLVGSGSLTNSGTIVGGANAVYGQTGATGALTNTGTGKITGTTGVYLRGTGVISNQGAIYGYGTKGVYLKAGGTLTNGTLGVISAPSIGVDVVGAVATVTNSGRIIGTAQTGVDLAFGGTLTNEASGTISGTVGVMLGGTSTVVNAGTIRSTVAGGTGAAVQFSTGNDLLQVEGGAYFYGHVTGGGGTSTIEFVSGTGTIPSFSNFQTIVIDSGASWTLPAGRLVTSTGMVAGTLVNAGTIDAQITLGNAGSLQNSGTVSTRYGVVYATGATGALTNTGTILSTAGPERTLYFQGGGTVTNQGVTALISGGGTGVYIHGAGTVTNAGTIHGPGMYGVILDGGGGIDNSGTAAVITGLTGVYIATAAGTIVNDGTIAGFVLGAALGAGGSITNSRTGTISGQTGILMSGATTITNAGTILGTAGPGITNFIGSANQTVINTGTIIGTGTAVQFGAGNDLLSISPSAVFTGLVDGGAGNNTLELATGTGAGTLTGFGTSFTNFGTLTIDTGADWVLPGSATIVSLVDAGTLTNQGTITGAVTVTATGLLTNQAGAVVTTGSGVAVLLSTGGSVSNAGLISGSDAGVQITGGTVQITNTGTILATSSAGVGVLFTGGSGTIDNFGTIGGPGSTSVKFAGNSNTLIIESGGVLSGIADGTDGTNTLILRGTGAIASAQIVGFQQVDFTGTGTTVDAQSSVDNAVVGGASAATLANAGTLTGTLTIGANGAVSNTGTIAITTGSTNNGTLANAGVFTNASSFTNAGSLLNTSTLTNNGTLTNTGSLTNSGAVLGATDGIVGGGTIANSGTIIGTAGTGVALTAAGTLTNTGLIQGGQYGVVVGAGGTVANSGTILDNLMAGASLGSAASLTNGTGATLSGAIGAIFTGTGASLVNTGTIAGTNGVAIQFDAGVNSLSLGTGSVLTGSIDGGGGAGQIALVGTGTLANTIANFGSGSALAIATAADWTASGTWTIASVTNAGTLQPGVAGSPLKLTGNFTQTSTGTLRVLLDDVGSSGSSLQITGSAALAGAVAVVPTGSFLAAKTYTILSASAGVTGTFGNGVSISSALLVPTLSYDATDAFVTLAQLPVASPPPPPVVSPPVVSPPPPPVVSPPTVSPPVVSPPVVSPPPPPPPPPAIFETPNEHATAVAFDQGLVANPAGFAAGLAGLDQLSAPALRSALDRLSGELHTALTTTALQAGSRFLQQFEQQGRLARLGAAGDDSAMAAGGRQQLAHLSGGSDDGATNDVSASVADLDKPWGVWSSGYGEASEVAGNGNSHRLSTTLGGGGVGADYKLTPALRIGAGLGYGGSSFSIDDGGGRAEVDHTEAALYAQYTAGPAYLDGTVGFAYGDGTSQRNVSLPGTPGVATGHFNDRQVMGAVETGYGFKLEGATMTPFAGLDVGAVDQNGFAETGAGVLDLHVTKRSQTSVKSTLGSRVDADLALGATPVTVDFSLGWAHEFAGVGRSAVLANAGAASETYVITGGSVPREAAVVGLGLATAVFADTSLYLRYDGDLAGSSSSHAVSAGFRFNW